MGGSEREQVKAETIRDLIDCVLGIGFCGSAILAVISPFGGHWIVFAAAIAVCFVSGGLFIGRWAKRGVFRSLGAKESDAPAN